MLYCNCMDELKDELKIDNSPGEESSFDIVEDTVETLNVLKENDPQKAKEHLQKAKEIIDANPDLKLRKAQWEKLAENFKDPLR